jgi:hypothetical protein
MSPALLRRVTHRRISPGQRHLAKQHWNQQRHTSKAVSGGKQRGSSPLCSTTQNPRYPCTRRHSAPGGADGEGSCDGVRRGVKSTWRATPVGCGARCLGSRETLRPKEQIAVWRLRSGPIQSIRLRLFAPSADACCSGGCGVGHEPASRALAWLPSRGAWRRAYRDFRDFFGREHPTTVGQRLRHWDSLRLEGDGADGVHTSLSGITQLQAAIHIALSIIFGLRSTNRST